MPLFRVVPALALAAVISLPCAAQNVISAKSGTLHFFNNVAVPTNRDADFIIGPILVLGRILYTSLGGGVEGIDYQVLWTATDTFGLDYPRTALMLCAPTS